MGVSRLTWTRRWLSHRAVAPAPCCLRGREEREEDAGGRVVPPCTSPPRFPPIVVTVVALSLRLQVDLILHNGFP